MAPPARFKTGGATVRRAVLPVRPDRVGSVGWALSGLSLSLLSLTALGGGLFALGGLPVPIATLPALAALHLLTVGFLLPVALSAMTQLSAALFAATPDRTGGRLLPVVWASGLGVAAGFLRPGPVLPIAGTALVAASLVTVASAARRALGAPAASADLRLAMLGGLGGLLLTLLAGVVTALAFTGAIPLPPPVGLHVALAASAAYVPLLLAVSTQLFPMFARCPPASTPTARIGPVAASVAGAAILCLGAAARERAAVVAGVAVSACAVTVWLVLQERMYRRRHGESRDPAAWAARVSAAMLVLAAWLALVHVAAGMGGAGWIPAAIVLALAGGVGGSVVAYLRRILPFTVWNALHQRLGRGHALPTLDALRPAVPLEVLPLLWAFGSAMAAWSLAAPAAGPMGRALDAHAFWPLGCAALLAALELGWAPAAGARVFWRARRAQDDNPRGR